ncbi:hypothetical protein KAR34_07325 [bacterium]|nr:hypothetical protein [bacterium]
MSEISSQEFRLFRICLVLTFVAPLAFLPLEHNFVSAGKLWWMYGIIGISLIYSAGLFIAISEKNYKFGVNLFVACHLVFNNIAAYLHSQQYLVITVLMVYTFIIIFNIILMPWPTVVVVDTIILCCAMAFIFIPGTGFLAAVKNIGIDVPFVITVVVVYYLLIIILGTGVVQVKRRQEAHLRELNRTLNIRVEQKVEEWKHADRVARQSQEQLVHILRSIPVGVVIFDKKLEVLYSNGVHFKMESEDALEPQSAGGAFLPLAILKENFLQSEAIEVLESEEDLIGRRLEFSTPAGIKKVIRYSCVFVKLSGEEEGEDRLVLVTEDITNEEAIREKMIHTNHLAGMGKMAASLVHEINNPLAGIRLNLELLELGLADEKKRKQVFHALAEGVERIDRIVKSFLSFARQEKPRKTKTNIQEVLQGTLAMAVNFKQFHRVSIKTEYAEGLPEILSDRYRLEQVFVNLLNNACDAMSEKGGVLRISTTQKDGYILITYQDDGIGIKQEDLSNIFSPFFTTKERGYGTGLGLSTSYGIIHEHGGVIEVESREGIGSTFTIRLPVEAGGEIKDYV